MNKWYQTKICKGILIGLAHLAVMAMMVLIVRAVIYQKLPVEILTNMKTAKKYEDTQDFNNRIKEMSQFALDYIQHQADFETDGAFNGDKLVDISSSKIVKKTAEDIEGKEDDKIYYRLGDLIDWGESAADLYYYDDTYYSESEMEEVEGNRNVIVCEKSDGTYYYYYFEDFKRKIADGDLNFVLETGEEKKQVDKELLGELASGYSANREIQNSDGEILYNDCWWFTGLSEKYLPVGETSLLDLVNEESQWNGRLKDILEDLMISIDVLQMEYSEYRFAKKNSSQLAEGNTNFSYMLVEPDKKKVYTNHPELEDFAQYENNIKQLVKSGKYVISTPQLSGFQSNIKEAQAEAWRDWIQGYGSDDYIFIAAVDTDYPIQDSFYTRSNGYSAYNPGILIFCLAAFFLILIWLTAVAGRSNGKEEVVLHPFDSIKTELAAVGVIGIGLLLGMFLTSIGMPEDIPASIIYIIMGGVGFFLCLVFLTGYLSLVRRIKAHTIWSNSVLKWLLDGIRKIYRLVHEIFVHRDCTFKLLVSGIGFLLVQSLVYLAQTPWLFLSLLIAEIVFLVYSMRSAIYQQKIREGLRRIAEGEIGYEIPQGRAVGEQLETIKMINRIGEGLTAAVEKGMKDERLKTDLITNVSHDIKTPLTSIINYVDLLKRENFTDSKILGYLDILEAKSQRLKELTEDVVEASKVSSGNINLEYMTLDLVEMIHQTGGEFQEKFDKRNLSVVMNLPETPVLVMVDGRRMWRVLENLFNNAAKYAMEGTRIYVDVKIVDQTVGVSVKNVSANQLNISPDELTERFIRGDESRTTEGSGLGLSIAKSLVQLQGGQFNLYIDGDLFKVVLTFPVAADIQY